MHWLRHPLVSIMMVMLIGAACGAGARWLARAGAAAQLAHAGGLLTHILIGIAGAFLGFHAAMLAGLGTAQPITPFLVSAVVSGLVLWGWRAARA